MPNEHRKAQLTLPTLSFKDREIVYVKILGELIKSDRVDKEDDGREPATVCKVLNLQDHAFYRLICPTLMVSAFVDGGEEYINKCYEIIVTEKPLPGKRYKGVEVYEIQCDAEYEKHPIKIVTQKDKEK